MKDHDERQQSIITRLITNIGRTNEAIRKSKIQKTIERGKNRVLISITLQLLLERKRIANQKLEMKILVLFRTTILKLLLRQSNSYTLEIISVYRAPDEDYNLFFNKFDELGEVLRVGKFNFPTAVCGVLIFNF